MPLFFVFWGDALPCGTHHPNQIHPTGHPVPHQSQELLHACLERSKPHRKPFPSPPGSKLRPKYLRVILQLIKTFLGQRWRCLFLGLGVVGL